MEWQAVRNVYVDVAFVGNFFLDLMWLWATAHLAGVGRRVWRLAAAAAAGAGLAVWACFPSGQWLTSLWGVVLGTLAVLGVGFMPVGFRQAVRVVGAFFLSGGAMAGAVLLLALRMPGSQGGAVVSVPQLLVPVGALTCLVGAHTLWDALQERRRLARGLYSLRISLGGQSVAVTALVDTGNELRDPLAGTPVAVVELAALRPVLPAEVMRAVSAGWAGLERLPGDWAARCRLVPYRAVGRPGGMLLALQPDELAVQGPEKGDWEVVHGLVGLTGDSLHGEGRYQALLPEPLAAAGVQGGE